MTVELTILVLLILGLAFMMLEAIVPSFGLFGLCGAGSFIAAIFMLRHLDMFYGMPVDAPLIASLGIAGLAVLAGSIYFIRLAWKTRASAGAETLIGAVGKVVEWTGDKGRVHVDGETWAATGPQDLTIGDAVRIVGRNQLVLTISKDF